MFVHLGFEDLKIISGGKDGGREGVPVPWSHGDKRSGEWSGPGLFQFNRESVLGIGKTRALGGVTDFNSLEHLRRDNI